MPTAPWAKVTIGLAALIWTSVLLAQGEDLDPAWIKPLGGVAGVVVLLLLLFDNVLWRLPVVRTAARRRVVSGTWKGELRSSWIDPETEEPVAPIEVYLVVRQTYSQIRTTLLSSESKSRSVTSTIDDPARGQCMLTAIYMNTPELLIQDRSRIHRGGLVLEVCGRPVTRLEGFYWTDRDSKGQLEFTDHRPGTYEDYRRAQREFQRTPSWKSKLADARRRLVG